MTTTQNNNQERVNVDYLIAVGITAIIAVIFLSLFEIEFGTTSINGSRNKALSQITMLPIEKNPKHKWQQNLIATIELLDPTVLSLPSTNYGFSRVRNLEYERQVKQISPTELKADLIENGSNNPIQLNKPAEEIKTILGFDYDRKSVMVTNVHDNKSAEISNQLYWTDRNGKIIESLSRESVDISKLTDEELVIHGPTKFLIINEENIIRAQLLKSCGNTNLDQAALSYLQRSIARIHSTSVPDKLLTSDNQLVILGHWQFIPELKFSEKLDLNEINNVYDWN